MLYCTVNCAVSDHGIGDLERLCKLRLWHNWATIAAFTWKECRTDPGISCACRDSGVSQKCKSRSFSTRSSLMAAHFRCGIQIVTRNVNTPLHSSVT